MRPSEFLTILWGAEPPGSIQLWELARKRSRYFARPDSVDYYADGRTDVYVGVGLAHPDPDVRPGAGRRARADEVIGIAGFWLDLDVTAPGKKGAALADQRTALRVARTGPTPTLLVSSGYGVHAWWLFEQPWRFASRAEQAAARTAATQWYALYRATAMQHGGGIDHTHDLARLLRLPGTYNGKNGDRAPVEVLDFSPWARYTRDGLLAYAAQAGPVAETTPPIGGETQPSGGVEHAASVPDRIRALIENDTVFADTWRNERADAGDWSMSEYDLSIATQLALADWTNADITIAVTLHRQRHDRNDPKAHRLDYLQRTVAKARSNAADGTAREQLRLLAATERVAA